MAIEFAGFVYNSSGVAVNGATVNLYDRNTTSPVRATTTSNSSGYWAISHATQGRFDVEIVNGSAKRRIKYDDAVQMLEVETSIMAIRNPANTFKYDITGAAILADRILTLPLTAGTKILAVSPNSDGSVGTLDSVVEDTSPQLGGALDIQTHAIAGNGGTVGIKIDSVGAVNMAGQPCVLAFNSADDANQTGNGAEATVDFDTEVFDQGGDFASDTFTAPITGRYLFTPAVTAKGGTSSQTLGFIKVAASNRSARLTFDAGPNGGASGSPAIGIIVDMDTSDTATITFSVSGEASDLIDIAGDGSLLQTWLSVQLLA